MIGDVATHRALRGPLQWLASGLVGGFFGCAVALVFPQPQSDHPPIAWWMVLPFAVLLACIALLPFLAGRFWHRHYPGISLFLGCLVAGFYITAFRYTPPSHSIPYGLERMIHSVEEFYSFIALVGGLYVVSGGILIELRGRATPLANTMLLAVGAVLANIVGTTGASMLLIRPFMRLNRGRLSRMHIVSFIFIVSNCGGCLTPIGDPPLYLGYLRGVPFFWTIEHLWQEWAFVVGTLLISFYVIDRRTPPTEQRGSDTGPRVSIRGRAGLICLALILVGVFIPPACKAFFNTDGLLIGATFQLAVASASYLLAPKELLKANDFTFEPAKEVALLFAGIFLTMVPALGYLATNSKAFDFDSAAGYYFGTGSLSAVLDNAPTYLSFLQIAFGTGEIDAAGLARFLSTPAGVNTLAAISTGAVFFGAMTYIGNGPNFMVKAIAEAHGVHMPGFLGYLVRACLILLPILVLHALIFVR